MADVWITDMRCFTTDPAKVDQVPAPARRIAEYMGSIVRAGTLARSGIIIHTALPCRRRPGRKPCTGHIELQRRDVPPEIEWRCSECGDMGLIGGWRGGHWDMSDMRHAEREDPGKVIVFLSRDEYKAMLKGGTSFDRDCEKTIFRAQADADGVMLNAGFKQMDYFADCLAAEANHETNRARRNLLDSACDKLSDALRRR